MSPSRTKTAATRQSRAVGERRMERGTERDSSPSNPSHPNHSLRKMPRLLGHGTSSSRQEHAFTSPITGLSIPRPSGIRRPAISVALTNAPSKVILNPQASPAYASSVATYQARKVRSQQELVKPLIELIPANKALDSASRKPSNATLGKILTSPESLRSNITNTDGGSSIRTRVDYRHPLIDAAKLFPAVSPYQSDISSNLSVQSSNNHVPPFGQQPLSSSGVPESTPVRFFILENLQKLVGIDKCQSLADPDALCRLVSQSESYETQQEIQERIFRHAYLISGPCALAHTPLNVDFASRSNSYIPQATLEAPVNPTPPSHHTIIPRTSPSLPMTEPASPAPGIGPKKSHHVGNILLGKLGWRSRTQSNQTQKPVPSKILNKSLRPSSFILNSNSNKEKGKNNNPAPAIEKSSNLEQPMARGTFEIGDSSFCVVMLGERLHVLPVLPFCVIEEIYRRGMRTPGILRISGDFDRIDVLMKSFESHSHSGTEDLSSEDIHTLCGLLKHYLRTLPEPLFHPLLAELFWSICVEPDQGRGSNLIHDASSPQLAIAQHILLLLPSRPLSLLAYLVPFLAQIPTFAENRVQHESLATLLGPAIFAPREIGLPGLGVYSRSAKANSTVKAVGVPWPSPSHPTRSPALAELDKTEVSRRATESTLWMMNYWRQIFSVVYAAEDSKMEEAAKKPNRASISTAQPVLFSTPSNPPSQPEAQLTDSRILGQQQPPSPAHSPTFSILTYSSGLSESRRSPAPQGSSQMSPPSSLQSHHLEATQLFASIQPEDLADMLRGPAVRELKAGLGLDFPVKDLIESQKEGKDKLKHQLSFAITFSKQPGGTDKSPNINSQNVLGLLTDYIGEKNEKISQQESLIESLVEEIGRLKTCKEKMAKEREIGSKEFKTGLNVHRNSVIELSPKMDNPLSIKSANSPPAVALDSKLHSPAHLSSSDSEEVSNVYIDYHDQMFNFMPNDDHNDREVNLEQIESSADMGETEMVEGITSDLTLNASTSSKSSSLEGKGHQYLDYHQQMFNYLSDIDGEAVEQLRLSKPSSEGQALSSENHQGTITRRLRRTDKDFNVIQSNASVCPDTSLESDLIDLDTSSDQSHTESLELEISRLKSINSRLLRKLTSIESILQDNF